MAPNMHSPSPEASTPNSIIPFPDFELVSPHQLHLQSPSPILRPTAPKYRFGGVEIRRDTLQRRESLISQHTDQEQPSMANQQASSRRVNLPNLPTGSAQQLPIPPYITNLQGQESNESFGSEDSVRTQVPMPFHLPDEMSSIAPSNYTGSPFATTPLSASATLPEQSTLNPYSSEFTPGFAGQQPNMYPAQSAPHNPYPVANNNNIAFGFDQQQLQHINTMYRPGSAGFDHQQPQNVSTMYRSDSAMAQNQIDPQYNTGFQPQPAVYRPGQPAQLGLQYNANGMLQYNTQGQYNGHQPYSAAPPAGPYDHFGVNGPQAGAQHGAYGSVYAGTQGFNGGGAMTGQGTLPHLNGQHASSMNGQPWGHQYQDNNGYGQGPRPAMSQSFAASAHNQYASAQQNPIGASFSQRVSGSFAPKNGNKGYQSSAHKKYDKNPKTLSNDFHVAPMLESAFNGNEHLTEALTNLKSTGGGDAGINKGVKIVSPVKEETDNDKKVTAEPKAAATPGPKPHTLELEFSSEPRKVTETPRLRHQGNRTIAETVQPKKTSGVLEWTQSLTTEGPHRPKSTPGDRRTASPPKFDLSASLSKSSTALATINESDPFVVPQAPTRPPLTPFRGLTNPFQPITALTTPMGGALVAGPPYGMSKQMAAFTKNGTHKPTLEQVLDVNNIPFVEGCKLARPEDWGVIKITNIPYSVTRSEVLAFLGRNARIVNEQEYEPIHIIMERTTSKTLDCYVEFISLNEAVNAVERFETNRNGGRGGRLGQRHVDVELSSQAALMKDLFPRAKNVKWHGSRPEIIPRDPTDIYNSGFQGFMTNEELVMLIKHVEAPQRSPFAKECPQRPFECLISTLLKFPWYMVEYITLQDRQKIYKAAEDLLLLLIDRVNNETDVVNLSPTLLKRVWRACLRCPGFTPVMKDNIVYLAGIDPQLAAMHGVPPDADHWIRLWALVPKPGMPQDMVKWYANILEESARPKKDMPLSEKVENSSMKSKIKFKGIFGEFNTDDGYFQNLRLDLPYGQNRLDLATLADIARYEWYIIERVFRQSFE